MLICVKSCSLNRQGRARYTRKSPGKKEIDPKQFLRREDFSMSGKFPASQQFVTFFFLRAILLTKIRHIFKLNNLQSVMDGSRYKYFDVQVIIK